MAEKDERPKTRRGIFVSGPSLASSEGFSVRRNSLPKPCKPTLMASIGQRMGRQALMGLMGPRGDLSLISAGEQILHLIMMARGLLRETTQA